MYSYCLTKIYILKRKEIILKYIKMYLVYYVLIMSTTVIDIILNFPN